MVSSSENRIPSLSVLPAWFSSWVPLALPVIGRTVGPALARPVAHLLASVLLLVCTASLAAGQSRIDAEAYRGEQFGVGRITIRSGGDFRLNLGGRDRQRPLGGRANGTRTGRLADMAKKLMQQVTGGEAAEPTNVELSLVEKSGRVFYPVFEQQNRAILQQFVELPKEATILFLFKGDAPLDLTIYSPEVSAGTIAPQRDSARYDQLLRQWWQDYATPADDRNSTARDYPALVEQYLIGTLSRRLSLTVPKAADAKEESQLVAGFKKAFESELQLLAGGEAERAELTAAILAGTVPRQAATEIVPEELPEPKPEVVNPPAKIAIEPIAMRVPVECLYVRFGSFPNFMWMRHRMEDWGGQLRDIIAARGIDTAVNERMQAQLGLRESALAELYGDKVIADVAMIGTDTFLADGASIGMLFHARENAALSLDLNQQRLAAVQAHPQGRREKLKIGGREVSFFSTPDNRVRSFYVVDGDFHLVTTSRTLVEWFVATGAGKHDALGASAEFRDARRRLPLESEHTVFVYLAPEFFHNLFGPRYQIEVKRRTRSAIEIDMVQVAQLAARAEGQPHRTIEELIRGGFLPAGFAQRPDGSKLVAVDGQWQDSLRGARGSFLPVADVDIGRVAAAEASAYRKFAETYSAQWGPMDPVVVGIRREALEDGQLERVTLDMQASPLSQQHSERLARWLGEPTDQRLTRVDGDVVSFEAVLRGGTLLAQSGEHHLFGALRDADPNVQLDSNAGILARLMTSQWDGLQGYVGAWPNPGFLRLFSGWIDTPVDATGTSRLLSGLWRQQINDFTLLSFHPEILNLAASQLRFERAPRPAQIWLRADDLANSKLAPRLNEYGYRQSRQILSGNVHFLNSLTEQLHVSPAECRDEAERLLGAKLVSPLRGDYQLRENSSGQTAWVATALADSADPRQVPADYQMPALHWLRGVDLEVSTAGGMLSVHGEMVMPVQLRAKPATDDEPGAESPPPGVAAPEVEIPGVEGEAPKIEIEVPKIDVELGEPEPVAAPKPPGSVAPPAKPTPAPPAPGDAAPKAKSAPAAKAPAPKPPAAKAPPSKAKKEL